MAGLVDTSAETHLTARGLMLTRGGRVLFENLDVALAPGELMMLRGPNGAGKSSLLRVLAGLLTPDAGDIRRPEGPPLYLGHHDALKAPLTVHENLSFLAVLEGPAAGDSATALNLAALLDVPVRELSAGQRRRVALSRLVPGRRRLWLLDEPMTALDEEARDWLWQTIEAHRTAGGMIMLATHERAAPGDARDLLLGQRR